MLYNLATTVTCHRNDKNEWVVYNWLNTAYAILDNTEHPFYVFLEKNKLDSCLKIDDSCFDNYSDDLHYLIDSLILVDDHERTIQHIKNQYEISRQNEHILSLIVLPAGEACNFNCVYCYEDHNQSSRMNDSHVCALEALIINSNANVTQIEYFGGEPLLNVNFILQLNSRIIAWSKSSKKQFYSSATTNGYLLTSDVLDALYLAQVHHFQITLDGLSQHHNKLRPLANGRGSFEQIVKNLTNIALRQDLDKLRVTIRVNFNESTSSDMDICSFLDFLKEMIGSDKRFSLLFRNIGDYAASNNRTTDSNHICSSNNVSMLMCKYENQAVDRGFRLAEADTCKAFGASSCYAAKPHNFVISPDWSVKKCTVALDKRHNNVGHLNGDGKLILNENYYQWIAPRLFSKKECNSCHFVAQCNSNACPLHNMENDLSICPPQKFTPIRLVEQLLSQES